MLEKLSAEAFAKAREEASGPAAAEIVVATASPASAGATAASAASTAIRSS